MMPISISDLNHCKGVCDLNLQTKFIPNSVPLIDCELIQKTPRSITDKCAVRIDKRIPDTRSENKA